MFLPNWMVLFGAYVLNMREKDEESSQIPGGHRLHTRRHEKARRRIRKASQRRNRVS